MGRDWHGVPHYARLMKEARFKDVAERKYAWPGNAWPKGQRQKTLGLCVLCMNALERLEAVSLVMMTRSLGMLAEEEEWILEDVRREIKNRPIHAYYSV